MVTYKDSGVDIEAGDLAVEKMSRHVRSTYTPQVLTGSHGGFAGLFQLDYPRGILRRDYRDPILVSCTDGVGTKLEIAFRLGIADTVGIDLVAMCVNDLIVQGAEPLFFLDYIAVGRMQPDQVADILKGIAAGCREARCPILGGETAEMPGFYRAGHYDLAGFAVGVVERSRLIDGAQVRPGDDIIGIASSGIHSNGYTLVRRVFLRGRRRRLDRHVPELGCTLGEELLRPTRIYVRPILALLRRYRQKRPIHALAHITGSGIPGNLPRVLPPNVRAVVDRSAWNVPPVFDLIQREGKVELAEMYRVFNMGLGMMAVVSSHFTDSILEQLRQLGYPAWRVGEIREARKTDRGSEARVDIGLRV
jgi:phosphoribosylformylglycinamidine cyclo-ligase